MVYSPSYHPYKDDEYKGVKIKHIYSPETLMGGSIGSFFYDFMSLKDALKRENFDIIYEAGYTSIIPAFIWFDVKNVTKSIVVTNMDGLEYKRTKFNKWVRKFVFWEERMAVKDFADDADFLLCCLLVPQISRNSTDFCPMRAGISQMTQIFLHLIYHPSRFSDINLIRC